jgi:thymidine kinase
MPLHIVCGPMFSEKSTTLYRSVARTLRAKKSVRVFVPTMDTRSAGQLKTHSGLSLESLGINPIAVSASSQIYQHLKALDPQPDLVVVDEAQFFDLDLPLWLGKVLHLNIIAAGLDLTSEGHPFGPMGALLCMANRVEKLTAICQCGREATRTACLVPKDSDVLVGGVGSYVPMCEKCWWVHQNP